MCLGPVRARLLLVQLTMNLGTDVYWVYFPVGLAIELPMQVCAGRLLFYFSGSVGLLLALGTSCTHVCRVPCGTCLCVGRSSGKALGWQHISHSPPVLLGAGCVVWACGLLPWGWVGTWIWTLLCRPSSIFHFLRLSLPFSVSFSLTRYLPLIPFPSLFVSLFIPACVA